MEKLSLQISRTLIKKVKDRVYIKTGVNLELEIKITGE